jgi:stage V sporulation protein B
MQKHSLLKGALILSVAGVIVKIIGAIYRIPLANIIMSEGMGYYQTAYPIYIFLLTISTTGIPTAISKLVSERIALGDMREAHRVFKVSFVALFTIGILSSVALFGGAKVLVELLGNSNAYYAMLAVAPALFFVPLMSAFRGYFQGMQNMLPTALSQIFEQLGRVIIGFALAIMLLPRGLEYAAAGASFGATSGAIAGVIVIYIIYLLNRRKIIAEVGNSPTVVHHSAGRILYHLFAIAIPITVGASVIPLMNMIDLGIVMRRLQFAGFSAEEANSLYGQLTGMAATLVNFPQVITVALAASLVPAISESAVRDDAAGVRRKAVVGLKAGIMIGLPAAIGLSVLAKPIMLMLYPKEPEVWRVLKVLGFGVLFLAVVQTATGILQGLGKPMLPVKNLLVGSAFKLVVSYILTGIVWINIRGAALGTVVGYMVAGMLNYRDVKKETGIKLGIFGFLIKPIISVIGMAVGVTITYGWIIRITGSNTISTLLSVIAGAIIYGILLLVLGGITYQELSMIPGGKRLSRLLKKLGLLRK